MSILKNRQSVLNLNKTRLIIQLILAWTNASSWQNSKSKKYLWLIRLIFIAPLLNPNLTASAQIVPDNTLPNNSVVTPNSNLIKITGGTTAGNNLFHSLEAFSVLTGQTAYFDNGLAIENILSRITGSAISNIDGLIRANGSANLFLINPNGIIFGQNASLDIGGSFVATTADGIKLGEEGFFSASDPENSQLLTIKPEVFWENSLANVQGTIVNQGNLTVAENLTLSAGNLDLQGQLQAGKDLTLQATDRIQIRGITEQPFVALAGTNLLIEGNQGIEIANSILTSLDNSQGVNVTLSSLENIALTDQTIINVQSAAGGNITVNSNNLDISSGSILQAGIKDNFGSPGIRGDIVINASNKVLLDGSNTNISNNIQPNVQGNAGNIEINTREIQVTNGAGIIARNNGSEGKLGNITINASETVILESGRIVNRTNGKGNAGNIEINTDSLQIVDGGGIINRTDNQGTTGNIIINATDNVVIENKPRDPEQENFDNNLNSRILNIIQQSQTIPINGEQNGGDIIIKTANLEVINGGRIRTNLAYRQQNNRQQIVDNRAGTSNAGNIIIEASNSVNIRGVSPNKLFRSLVSSSVDKNAKGNGGNITINQNSLDSLPNINIEDGAIVTTSTFGKGNPGNITIEADNLNVSGEGITKNLFGLLTSAIISRLEKDAITELNSNSRSGNIDITANSINLRNGGVITSDNLGKGKGGDITIQSDFFSIENTSSNLQFTSGISSRVGQSGIGNGGDIVVKANNLLVKNGGQIRSGTLGKGNAGNITISGREQNSSEQVIFDGRKIFDGTIDQQGNPIFLGSGNTEKPFFIIDGTRQIIIPSVAESAVGQEAKGNGGTITINTNSLQLLNQGSLNVSSKSQGNVGSIVIEADFLELNNQGKIQAETNFNNDNINDNNIALIIDGYLILQDNSLISAKATEQANGGNVEIDANFIVAFPDNNDIIASAEQGKGGNINVTTNALLGIEDRPATPLNQTNDIDASSEFGLNGTISIEVLAIEPAQGLTKLPSSIIDRSRLISKSCLAGNKEDKFVVTGRGGLPTNPNQSLRDDTLLSAEWITLPQKAENDDNRVKVETRQKAKGVEEDSTIKKIVEAQGWIIGDKGNVILTAAPTVKATAKFPGWISQDCYQK